MELTEDYFSAYLHVYNFAFHDGNMSNLSETQYEFKTSFCHEITVVKLIILILAPRTYDKWTHIDTIFDAFSLRQQLIMKMYSRVCVHQWPQSVIQNKAFIDSQVSMFN